MFKMKDDKKTILIIISIVLGIMLLFLLYNTLNPEINVYEDTTSSGFSTVSNGGNLQISDFEDHNGECTLDFSSNVVCKDETFIATLFERNNGPNNCYIFVNDSGWKAVYSGITNVNGIWSEYKTIGILGSWDFIGVCDRNNNLIYEEGIDCVTNIEKLTVQDCSFGTDDGDVVGGAEGTEYFENDEYIEMDMSGIVEGNCSLMARIQYDWNYVDADACQQEGIAGVPVYEGVLLEFDDSVGTVWESYEYSPNPGVGDETDCGLVWDGTNVWRFYMSRIKDIPGCEIELNYDVDIITCECGEEVN